MILLLDVGNTNTHLGAANAQRVLRQAKMPTSSWFSRTAPRRLLQFVGAKAVEGVVYCSVVPRATPCVEAVAKDHWGLEALGLTHRTIRGIGIDYPKPRTIGPDRLANALAACHHHGAPCVVVDFGTAVTFDVVDRRARYVGGIIAPGLAAMTEYLHERTALLPRIRIREVRSVIGKSTREAMLIGAVHGYRGLVRELLLEIRKKLRSFPVVATGGYAGLIASRMPEIDAVDPNLTLEGLRLLWRLHRVPD